MVNTCGNMECPVCYENNIQMENLSCGHNICKYCSNKWFERSNTCPLCRSSVRPEIRNENLNDYDFFPN